AIEALIDSILLLLLDDRGETAVFGFVEIDERDRPAFGRSDARDGSFDGGVLVDRCLEGVLIAGLDRRGGGRVSGLVFVLLIFSADQGAEGKKQCEHEERNA